MGDAQLGVFPGAERREDPQVRGQRAMGLAGAETERPLDPNGHLLDEEITSAGGMKPCGDLGGAPGGQPDPHATGVGSQ